MVVLMASRCGGKPSCLGVPGERGPCRASSRWWTPLYTFARADSRAYRRPNTPTCPCTWPRESPAVSCDGIKACSGGEKRGHTVVLNRWLGTCCSSTRGLVGAMKSNFKMLHKHGTLRLPDPCDDHVHHTWISGGNHLQTIRPTGPTHCVTPCLPW